MAGLNFNMRMLGQQCSKRDDEPPLVEGALLMEDGVSYVLMEDGVSKILLE
jgi:hypothetical protein